MESEILFRASQVGRLMTDPKLNADKLAGKLGQTAKSYIEEIWLNNNFGYKEEVMTDEMLKGLICEQDSMELVQQVLGGDFRVKNRKNFKNDYLTGTPDIVLTDSIEDLKTSFTVKTFFNSELNSLYYWQGQVYMELTGKKYFRLIYCLVNTPKEIILDLEKRVYYKFSCDEDNPHYKLWVEQIRKNHNFDNIPAKNRIKVFEFVYNPEDIEKMYRKIDKAREYYKSLTL